MDSRNISARRKLRAARARWLIIIAAIAAGLAGYYGPWVPHKAAGLIVTGLDLAEYVKFLPDVIAGKIVLSRELFYLPLFAASINASLGAGRRALPSWSRVLLALAAIPLAAAMLPPAWSPPILVQLPEFRLQVVGIVLCLGLIPGALLTRTLPDRLILILSGLLNLAAALAPVWGFLQVHPAIEALYRHALPLGWGFWVSATGFLVATVIAIAEAIRG